MTSMLDALKLLQEKREQAATAAERDTSAPQSKEANASAAPAAQTAPAGPTADAAEPRTASDQTRDPAAIEADLNRAAGITDQELATSADQPPTGVPEPTPLPPTAPAVSSPTTHLRATASPDDPSQGPPLGGTEIAGLNTASTAPRAAKPPARSRQQPRPPATGRREKRASERARERRAAEGRRAPQPAAQAKSPALPAERRVAARRSVERGTAERRTAERREPSPPPVAIRTVRPQIAKQPSPPQKPKTFADKLTAIQPDGSVRRPPPPVTPPPETTQDDTRTVPFEVIPQSKDGPVKQPYVHPISKISAGKNPQPDVEPTSAPAPPTAVAKATAGPIDSAAAAAKKLLNIGVTQVTPAANTDKEQKEGRRYFEQVLNQLRNAGLRTEYRDLWNHIDRQQGERNILFLDCENQRPAAEVMVYLAGSGKDSRSILLIDADRQSRRLTRLLRAEHERGLTDCPDLQQMGQVLQDTGLPSTKFLPVGHNTGDVTSQHMAFILSELTNMFDFAFIAGGTADNELLQQLPPVCGESYLVVRLGTTMREAALDSLRSFGTMGVNIGACIVANSLADPTNR